MLETKITHTENSAFELIRSQQSNWRCEPGPIRRFKPLLIHFLMKGNLMATKKTPHLSRKQRKAFIAAMLDRFTPKMPSPFALMETAQLSSNDR